MSADFTPNMESYKNPHYFRFWCQKVLPLVYDDSLSYYELLCKVVKYLNDVIEDSDAMKTNIGNLLVAYNELQNYVNHYFDSLNVQEAINNKLDDMAETGALAEIINQNLLATIQADVQLLEQTKRNKTDTDYVGMAQLTQEVKEALTGGSTPVVGENAVATVNLVDHSVTHDKLAINQYTVLLLNGFRADIDTTDNVVSFSGAMQLGGRRYDLTDYTVALPGENLNFLWATPSGDNVTLQFSSPTVADSVCIGDGYGEEINLYYAGAVFKDGVRQHRTFDGWTNYTADTALMQTGPKHNIVVDFNQSKVIILPGLRLKKDNYIINLQSTEHTITDQQMYLVTDVDGATRLLSDSVNVNNYYVIGYLDTETNYADISAPHTVVTSPNNYYNVLPEMVVYGDSIAAGYGGLGFENILAARTGIRVLNRGIGSTGYLKTVEAGTAHIVGQNDIIAGINQTVDFAANNVQARITADIATIEQDIVILMAGTNDQGSYTNEQIVESMAACTETIYNAGKIPIVISPMLKAGVNMIGLVQAMKDNCESRGVPFLDMTRIGINPNRGPSKLKYMPDGLHPNDAGYQIIAAYIGNYLKNFCIPDMLFGRK